MIDKKYIELINRKIDGSITDSEHADLDRYLTNTPEARDLHDEMVQLSALPELLPPVDPPPELKQHVLAAIAAPTRRAISPGRRVVEFLSAARDRLHYRFAYGFAAGLLIGLAAGVVSLTNLGQRGIFDPAELSGTMGLAPEIGRLRYVDEDAFECEDFAGAIMTGVAGNLVFIRLEIQSDRESSVAFEYEPHVMQFQGYRQLAHQTGSLDVRPGVVRLMHAGRDEYILIFKRSGPSRAVVSGTISGDGTRYERQIVISQNKD